MKLHELVRLLASYAPLAGLAPEPEPRPNGISALVRVRGDEEWIEPCLRSVRAFADEAVVLDNGAAPDTRESLARVAGELGGFLRLESCPDLDFVTLSNRGLALARYRWLIRWDADFVAYTSGPHDIRGLRRYLLDLDPRRYYLVYVRAAEVAGDLFHQFPDLRDRYDGQAAVWSAALRYVAIGRTLPVERLATPDRVLRNGGTVRHTLEALATPRYYRVTRWPAPAYLHVNVKSGRRLLLRHFWLEWLDASRRAPAPPLDEYVRRRVREEWGLGDLDAAERAYVTAYCKRLVPFDAARYGPYPDALTAYLDRPRYRVEYRDGVVVGRSERQ